MAAVAANPTRIHLDPDALNWSPSPVAGILFESPLKCEASGGEEDSEDEEEETEEKNSSVLGNFKGLAGGASLTSKHRRKKHSSRKVGPTHRDLTVKHRESNGDSADCEQSDDSDTPAAGDAKYLKTSPKSSLNRSRTYIKSPKIDNRRKKSSRIATSEDDDSSLDRSADLLKRTDGRQATKTATSATSKSLSKQQRQVCT